MVFGFLVRCVSTVVGAFVPMFFTFKSLVRPNKRADQVYWLKYWAIFGAAQTLECALEFMLIPYLFPGYEIGRLLFLLYAVNPITNGAQGLFDSVLRPFIAKHEKELDAIGNRVILSVKDKAGSAFVAATSLLTSIAFRGLPAVVNAHIAAVGPPAHGLVQNHLQSRPLIREIKEELSDSDDYEVEIVSPPPPTRASSSKSAPAVQTTKTRKVSSSKSTAKLDLHEDDDDVNDGVRNDLSGDSDVEYIPPETKRNTRSTTRGGKGGRKGKHAGDSMI